MESDKKLRYRIAGESHVPSRSRYCCSGAVVAEGMDAIETVAAVPEPCGDDSMEEIKERLSAGREHERAI